MTTDRPTVAGTATTVLSADLSYLVRRRIFLYLGILIVMLAFGAPGSGLIDIPITFLLKNKLHLTIFFKDRACEAVVANQSGFVTSKIIVLMTADEMDQAFKKAMTIEFLPPGE
jgi:hypothetical protein